MISNWLRPAGYACVTATALALSSATSVYAETPTPVAAPEHAPHHDPSRTRFVIGLEKSVQFQVFSLSNPNRVVVELPDVKVSLPTLAGDKPVGLVKSFRGGTASADKMRVVIDVTEPVIVAKSEVEKGKDRSEERRVGKECA